MQQQGATLAALARRKSPNHRSHVSPPTTPLPALPAGWQGISASLLFLLLAACGGGSGNFTTSPESEPPVSIGPIIATSGEQQKTVVNQEEEEEEEEEETQTQQIIIIEEEDIPYVPPEEKEPETSPQTQVSATAQDLPPEDPSPGLPDPKPLKNAAGDTTDDGTLNTYSYGIWNKVLQNGVDRDLKADIINKNDDFKPNAANRSFVYPRETYTSYTPEPGDFTGSNDLYTDPRDFRSIADSRLSLTYQGTNAFKGAYSYMGSHGSITDDVTLRVIFYHPSRNLNPFVDGYIGGDDGITLGDHNLGKIFLLGGRVDGDDGTFASEIIFNGSAMLGSGTMRGSFSNDGSADGSAEPEYPSKIAGEVEIKGFIRTGEVGKDGRFTSGNDLATRGDNGLAGVFIVEKEE